MTNLKLAVIPGDGTGPEVTAEALKILNAVAPLENFKFETTNFDWGCERYLRTGETLPKGGADELRKFNAVFLGAVGHPDVAPGVIEKGLLLALRFELDQYINLRPVQLFPGVETPLAGKEPKDIDFVVVRENTEDLYCGVGGFLKKNTPDEVATQAAVYTRKGCERCIRWAFEYTRKRNNPKGKMLTLVAKTNVLTFGHDLWWRAFQDVAQQYPDVKADYNHVDACCMWMVKSPEYYDVIVTTNMFGDIITDLSTRFVLTAAGVAYATELCSRNGQPSATTVNGTPQRDWANDARGGPRWDSRHLVLHVDEIAVTELLAKSRNQLAVLTAFEAQGWPRRIDNPLECDCPARRAQALADAVHGLNRNLRAKVIRFHTAEKGGSARYELLR